MFTKLALKRAEGWPVGQPAPMYVDCLCGRRELWIIPEIGATCDGCGRQFDSRGWIVGGEPPTKTVDKHL